MITQSPERKEQLISSLRAMREKICAADLDDARRMIHQYDEIEAELKQYDDWPLIAGRNHFKTN